MILLKNGYIKLGKRYLLLNLYYVKAKKSGET